jgi:probable HAF family extracellular repeat protein
MGSTEALPETHRSVTHRIVATDGPRGVRHGCRVGACSCLTSPKAVTTLSSGCPGPRHLIERGFIHETTSLRCGGFGPLRGETNADYIFTTIDPPSSTLTVTEGINNSGQIVGWYADVGDTTHGFLLSGGTYTRLDLPGSLGNSRAYGINGAGQIVGSYAGDGFLLSGGSYTTLHVPGSTLDTEATGINNRGQIVGNYYFGHGFLLSGGSYTTLDRPNAGSTHIGGINDAGQGLPPR